MIRASILWALVAVVAVERAQAHMILTGVKECTGANKIYYGPMPGQRPVQYNVSLDISTSGGYIKSYSSDIRVEYKFNSLAQDKDIIVVHADKSVKFKLVLAQYSPGFNIDIDSVCRISAKQLMVIKLKKKLCEWRDSFKLSFVGHVGTREDQQGLHKVNDDLIRANFDNSQARLIMPCFDDPDYKSNFNFKLTTSKKFKAESAVLKCKSRSWTLLSNTFRFHQSEWMSIDRFSFDLVRWDE